MVRISRSVFGSSRPLWIDLDTRRLRGGWAAVFEPTSMVMCSLCSLSLSLSLSFLSPSWVIEVSASASVPGVSLAACGAGAGAAGPCVAMESLSCVGAGARLCSKGNTSSIGTNRAVEVSLFREIDLRGGIVNGDENSVLIDAGKKCFRCGCADLATQVYS